ncbi:MAG: TonB-dependent receptor plug domain-containing protein, partial [Bacteroidia bacterium]|nr:TonB-dependent receptor plug domain-containing protein [Bacteroidia bacterium]
MRRISLLILCIASLTCRSFRSAGENGTAKDSTDFYNMSLEQLMNVEVSIASRASQTPRESPGIVTVITREEILHSGASDLMELLSRVPGFDFGVDVQGVVGV